METPENGKIGKRARLLKVERKMLQWRILEQFKAGILPNSDKAILAGPKKYAGFDRVTIYHIRVERLKLRIYAKRGSDGEYLGWVYKKGKHRVKPGSLYRKRRNRIYKRNYMRDYMKKVRLLKKQSIVDSPTSGSQSLITLGQIQASVLKTNSMIEACE